jgi:hypothetical protein
MRVLRILSWLLLPALIFAAGGPARAERHAFIVGNSAYTRAQPLPNPVNDARDLASRLQTLGYRVSLNLDVGRTAFLANFQKFIADLKPDDVALFFFAGHGLQIGGENYLFPIDANVETEADARGRLIALNALISDLSRASRTRIVILDACRNNPFSEQLGRSQATRSAGVAQGLARVYAGVGSFIAYSTEPGNVALDGDGRNSPFTGALIKHMTVTGADVHAVMRRVRADVQKATADRQIPWENSSLVAEMAFAEPPPDEVAPSPPPTQPPSARQDQVAANDTSRPRFLAASYSYVTGLDPKGDNFLALRTAPGSGGSRIATLGPDTLLTVLETRGVWRRVQLLDGTSGWAHGNWIACCRSVASFRPPQPTPPPASGGESCAALWTQRNAVWHRYGYCFTTARGQSAFGNQGCFRDQAAARAAMSASDRSLVDALAAREKALGCR